MRLKFNFKTIQTYAGSDLGADKRTAALCDIYRKVAQP